jgi:hypothetical protein
VNTLCSLPCIFNSLQDSGIEACGILRMARLQFSLQFPAGTIGRPVKRAFRVYRPSVIAAEGRRPQNRYEGLNPAARSPPASRRPSVFPPQWRNVRGPLSCGRHAFDVPAPRYGDRPGGAEVDLYCGVRRDLSRLLVRRAVIRHRSLCRSN